MSKRRNDAEPFGQSLETFFRSELAENAGSHLSKEARVALHIEGERTYLFRRGARSNEISPEQAPEADVHFYVPLNTMRYLLQKGREPASGIGSMGRAVVEHLFHADPQKKIRFRVDTGFFGLWARGYFSVLKAGGPEVASYLADWGYGSLSRLKDLLRQARK